MTTFDDRERAFENLFVHDQDLAFRARARRDRDIGLWAAHRLGHEGEAAQAYAGEVLQASMERNGTEAVLAKLRDDLQKHGRSVTEREIHRRMDELLAVAIEHLKRD